MGNRELKKFFQKLKNLCQISLLKSAIYSGQVQNNKNKGMAS